MKIRKQFIFMKGFLFYGYGIAKEKMRMKEITRNTKLQEALERFQKDGLLDNGDSG